MADLTIGLVTGSPAYGGVEQITPVVLPDLDVTPQVLPTNSDAVTFPQNFTQDIANEGIKFGKSGIWQLSATFGMTFTELNAGRKFELELYNNTKDTRVLFAIISIGRNAGGVNATAVILVQVAESFVGDLFQMRVLSTEDTFEAVSLNFFALNAIRIDSLRTS